MLFLKLLDAAFLVGLIVAIYWGWKHQADYKRKILVSNAMPREASRGLVYGFLIILLAGAVMVSVYWLF